MRNGRRTSEASANDCQHVHKLWDAAHLRVLVGANVASGSHRAKAVAVTKGIAIAAWRTARLPTDGWFHHWRGFFWIVVMWLTQMAGLTVRFAVSATHL